MSEEDQTAKPGKGGGCPGEGREGAEEGPKQIE